jgi:mitochondrial fission protein ELM1
VVLMKPGRSLELFDLCLIPAHDGVPPGRNVVVTRGVLNSIVPSATQEDDRGLILIGGPSKHHRFSEQSILEQLHTVIRRSPDVRWTLTTSRRTPASLLPAIRARSLPRLDVVPCEATSPEWVPEQLARSGRVWVSEDSVSMVYEAITAGARVGVLEVPRLRRGRVVCGVEQLIAEGWLTPWRAWRDSGILPRPPQALNEAERCAEIIFHSWLQDAGRSQAAA